jgi:type IVB pilus formation R64 PilN family outer membrane protein
MTLRKSFLAVAVAASLAGCATTQSVDTRGAELRSEADDAMARRTADSPNELPYFRVVDELYLGATAVDAPRTRTLPEVFRRPLIYRQQRPVTLNEIAEFVGSNYGVPVVITRDALDVAAESVRDPVASLLQQSQAIASGGQQGQAQQTQPQAGISPTFTLIYEGDMEGFFDQLTAKTGTSWKWESGTVVVFGTETRIFPIDMQPGQTQFSSSIDSTGQAGGGSGGSGGGGESGGGSSGTQIASGLATTRSMSVDGFGAATEAVKGMLSPRGKMAALPSLNQITVTDVPAVLDRVDAFVRDFNALATRQVALDIRIYSVEMSNSDGMSIRWDAVFNGMGPGVDFDIGGGGVGIENATNFTFENDRPGSSWDGTKLFVDALARQGRVTEVTSYSTTVLSGKPQSVQIGDQTTYLANASQTVVPNVGVQRALTPGSVSTGFALHMVPTVVRGDEVLLSMAIDLSTLRELREVGNIEQGAALEAPNVSQRQLTQDAKLSSGETLVLAGLEQENLRDDRSGVGDASFPLLGGSRQAGKRRNTLVMLVTPRVINR